MAGRYSFCLGHTDTGNLRITVGAIGDMKVVDCRRIFSSDALHGDDALMEGNMRELLGWDDITNGVHTRNICLHIAVDLDVAALHRDAQSFEPYTGSIRGTAGSHKNLFGSDGLPLSVICEEDGLNARIHCLGRLEERAGIAVDSLSRENASQFLRDIFVLKRNQVRKSLEQCDLRSKGVVDGSKLHADGTRTHDQQGLRNGI